MLQEDVEALDFITLENTQITSSKNHSIPEKTIY